MSSSTKYFLVCLVFGLGIFVASFVFRLMFVKGYKYQNLADKNRVRKTFTQAKRGSIRDRHGEVLVQDVATNGDGYVRKYAVSEPFGHILGYVGEMKDANNKAQAKCREESAQEAQTEKVGIGGIEEYANCALRGSRGVIYTEVNAQEKAKKQLEMIPTKDGDDVYLTIDTKLQESAYKSFDSIPGAAIIMDTRSSEILAIVSVPSFDPSAVGNDLVKTNNYLNDPRKPLFDRATLGTYPPGSVFKPVVAAAALTEGKVKVDEKILDTGYRTIGGKRYANWLYTEYGGRTDGSVDMVKSLKRSNDIYYYEMGERLGVDSLVKYSQMFGFGSRTGIEVRDMAGVVPSAFWKNENVGEKWFLGDTYNFAIGQGYLLTTPLQVAVMTQIVANSGNYCPPTILSEKARNKNIVTNRTCKKLPISDKVFLVIKNGMEEACAAKGTGWPFFDLNSPNEATTSAEFVHYKEPVRVACKTGTAEHYVEGNEEPHGWMTLFAPSSNPKIAITVLAEKGGQGSDSAGPIVRKILDKAIELGYLRD